VELAYPPDWEARIYTAVPDDVWRELPQLQTPLLVIHGAESDTFFPDAARELQRRLPHAQLRAVPGAGHLVPLEQPEAVAAATLAFLAAG
jgi:pimeloyl-ACP methyl ester carboxylesterase